MLKDILVYLDGSSGDEARIAYAEQLARRHEAFLTGLVVVELPYVLIGGETGLSAAQVAQELQDRALTEGTATFDRLKARFAKLDLANDLRRIDAMSGQRGQLIAAEARTADVFVGTRPYNHASAMPETMETVLFNSGRGCLFVPPVGMPTEMDNVLLAWRNGREAARAVVQAMPFLKAAKSVTVAMVDERGSVEEDGREPGADLARHLDRHGISVELRHITGWSNTGEALLNEAERTGANLMVLGAYGHSRLRELVLGGVTRKILSDAEIPTLVAH